MMLSAALCLLLLDTNSTDRIAPTSEQVTVTPGIAVTIRPGKEGYPGIKLAPKDGTWDLSAFGHVEARVVNTGAKPISISLRVDNSGDWQDGPWNTESVYLKPGNAGTITTIFGYSYGRQPGYALKPAAVTGMLIFATKSDAEQSFRLESLAAAGPAGEKLPVNPDSIRTKPKDGVLTGTSPTFKPEIGRWDLRDYLEVRVNVRNNGETNVTPRVRLESNGGPTDWITAAAPLAPGAAQEFVIPFAGKFVNDAVFALAVLPASLVIESGKAAVPAQPELPAWLGQRPPVEGDWIKTFDDEFDGNAIDESKWNVYGPNYWDKTSHWSKDNVIVGGGVVRLRYEKKTGFQNDDPKQKRSAYASGFLETYGKWTQRYGYFEARMKLPTAPGLWPSFWMMPDRGAALGEQWKRQDTANGGMEFDIMEHLTRWGPFRYNIAMHHDGYGKQHKMIGSDKVYVQPDKDGFLTCGLLWTPGSAVYYCNGREVYRWENPRISNVASDMMFTLPMGGWDNNRLDDAQLPADFIIDYVRVWQRKDLAE